MPFSSALLDPVQKWSNLGIPAPFPCFSRSHRLKAYGSFQQGYPGFRRGRAQTLVQRQPLLPRQVNIQRIVARETQFAGQTKNLAQAGKCADDFRLGGEETLEIPKTFGNFGRAQNPSPLDHRQHVCAFQLAHFARALSVRQARTTLQSQPCPFTRTSFLWPDGSSG